MLVVFIKLLISNWFVAVKGGNHYYPITLFKVDEDICVSVARDTDIRVGSEAYERIQDMSKTGGIILK